jgi:hypothetical protein
MVSEIVQNEGCNAFNLTNGSLSAWSRSREPDAASRAHKVFERMERAFENGNLSARPGTMTYNTLINGEFQCCPIVALLVVYAPLIGSSKKCYQNVAMSQLQRKLLN